MSKYVPPHLRAGAAKSPPQAQATPPSGSPPQGARHSNNEAITKDSENHGSDRYRAPHQRSDFKAEKDGARERESYRREEHGDRYRAPAHRDTHLEEHGHGSAGHSSSYHSSGHSSSYHSSSHQNPPSMFQSTRNKFYHEKRLHFAADRGRLFVGKGRRNVLSIIEKTGVKEIDVPVGKGLITIRGAEKDGVEKAVVRCAARLAQVELKEKSQEPIVFLHPVPKQNNSVQLFKFEPVTFPNTSKELGSDKYFKIKELSTVEVEEFNKEQEKKKKETDDFWQLTFGTTAPPTLANQEVVEEKQYFIAIAHLIKHITTKAFDSSPTNVEVSCAFGQQVFLNIPSDLATKVYTLTELHATLEKERFKFFFRWGVQQEDITKIQQALENIIKKKTDKIVKKDLSVKEVTVVESDLDGNHYSSVKIQYFPEREPKIPEVPPVQTEKVDPQKKKKKKKAVNTVVDFQPVVNRRKKGKGEDEETKESKVPEIPQPKPLSGLEYTAFNDREALVSLCMIGLPLDVQLMIGDGSSSRYAPGQAMRQFAETLRIDESSSKLAPPAGGEQNVIQGQSSVLYVENSTSVSIKNYVFEPENCTLQIKEKEKEASNKEKEKSLVFSSTLPKGLLPPAESTTIPAEALGSTITPLVNRLSMLSKLLV